MKSPGGRAFKAGKGQVEFRLVYQGPLHADSGIDEKQAIRRKLHLP